MLIDCGSCPMRERACAECVVSVLFGDAGPMSGDATGGPVVEGDLVESRALGVLIDSGFEVTVLSREQARPGLRVVGSPRHGRYAA